MRQHSFSVSLKNNKNPNHQNNSFYILCIEFTMDYKTGQKIFPPPLHGLSLRKSPIKNHAILFWVGSSSESNTIRLHKAQQVVVRMLQSHWWVTLLIKSQTLKSLSASSWKCGGCGNHLWELILMDLPSPTSHMDLSIITSWACNKLHQTKDGFGPSLASIKEQWRKHLALYTR